MTSDEMSGSSFNVEHFSDPEQLFENIEKYPNMEEEIEEEFGEVTEETCRKAIEQLQQEFTKLVKGEKDVEWPPNDRPE